MTKIILFESIPLLRQSLVEHLSSEDQIIIPGPATASGVLPLLSEENPDILWLDETIPEIAETELLLNIHRKFPKVLILLFGTSTSITAIKKHYKHGIHAFVLKTATIEEIQSALQEILQGNLFIPASLTRTFRAWLTNDKPLRKKKHGDDLTQREKEILELIVEEHTTCEIAKKLFISHCTVETHRVHLIQKLGVKNTAGLVRVAFEAGLYGQSYG